MDAESSYSGSEAPLPETLAERSAALLQRDILTGRLLPDSKLVISDLADSYGIGATPIREGLSRLVAQGLVIAIGQKGFRVAQVSREDLADIIRMRSVIESEALRLSMERGGDEWEAGIVASLHRLKRFAARGPEVFRKEIDSFERVHKAFHTALIAACGSRRMLEQHSALYDQTYRYRHRMLEAIPPLDDFCAEHEDLAELAIARDAEKGGDQLCKHFALTLTTLYPDTPAKIPTHKRR
ncbi:GntR family transcriptional regulator [Pseudorhodoplanes sinuspersici]|uniref:GntR family transcriptional regulator n=1 Tax=Pseudorhodoplanes sinuspersici TaxID=1235591 RepID=A0A1W6ZS40_9HYPH|nr:FCD domain-containing protein [Pseudorhodoplanes sinuspersici]ARQ00217.1 GntR family transcriptional regulator [Pseudorhodoplanes sinuspersici]RKE67639.1 GntR family transcriptional regulator [Pseudorhodoplanes sinuspersici]